VRDDGIWLPTISGAARLRNVAISAHVSLAFVEGEEDSHAAVLMEGPASVIEGAEAPPALMEMWAERFSSEGGWIARWIIVRPQRLFSYAAPGWRL
jgi:hypothetical protein